MEEIADMSINIQYCFNSDLAPPALALQVSQRLGCSLTPARGDPETLFTGTLLGIELKLWVMQGMANDRDLNFEDYRYQLSNKTSADSGLRPIQTEVIACSAFVLYEILGIHQGMLCYEVQTLLARYDLRDGDWYDLVGDKVVVYPEHLVDIEARLLRSLGA
ncbi:MAG TPA: hypothetical protein VGS07_24300 [Thermoanaerobaculia bacterium]|nr:hypothetical protein [Thermoanaerobaculia bacterium]